MPTLSFRNLLGFSRNQHSLKAEAEKMAKKIVYNLVKNDIEQILKSCEERRRDYGPRRMPITFSEQEIYQKCKIRSDGIDTTQMTVLEKMLVDEILKQLPTEFQSVEKKKFQDSLTDTVNMIVCANPHDSPKNLQICIYTPRFSSQPKIRGYFNYSPENDVVGRCVEYAIKETIKMQENQPSSSSSLASQSLSRVEGSLPAAGSEIIYVGSAIETSLAISSTAASSQSDETGKRLSDGSSTAQEGPASKSIVEEEEKFSRDSTPTILKF